MFYPLSVTAKQGQILLKKYILETPETALFLMYVDSFILSFFLLSFFFISPFQQSYQFSSLNQGVVPTSKPFTTVEKIEHTSRAN